MCLEPKKITKTLYFLLYCTLFLGNLKVCCYNIYVETLYSKYLLTQKNYRFIYKTQN